MVRWCLLLNFNFRHTLLDWPWLTYLERDLLTMSLLFICFRRLRRWGIYLWSLPIDLDWIPHSMRLCYFVFWFPNLVITSCCSTDNEWNGPERCGLSDLLACSACEEPQNTVVVDIDSSIITPQKYPSRPSLPLIVCLLVEWIHLRVPLRWEWDYFLIRCDSQGLSII